MPNKTSSPFWRKIEQRLPIFGFLRNYSGSALLDDAIAGTTVALTVIPQSVAIAAVAGLPAQYGLYSAFINGFVYAVFGSVKEVSIGPTVVTAMLTQPYVLQFGPEVATTICIYSGIIVTLLGIFNLGFVVDLISTPVLAGFMSAAGLSVMTGQIPALLGIAGGGSNFLQYWIHIWKHAHEARLWDVVLGVCCIIVIFALQYLGSSILRSSTKVQLLQRRAFTVPLRYLSLGRNAIVVVICTAAVAAITQSGMASPVRVCGDIPVGLPSIALPRMTIWDANDTSLGVADTANYLLPSLVMPLNIIVESMMSANAFARGTSIDTSQELLAVGACNVIGSFFQSFSVAGSITRTAINHASNVRTTFGGVVTSTMVILSLVYLTAALKFLPNATLGAVVFCAVAFLVRIHIDAKRLWRSCKLDLLPLFSTFVVCLLLGPDVGMTVGIVVNALLAIYQASMPLVTFTDFTDPSVLVVRPDRALTYLSTDRMRQNIVRHAKEHRSILIDGSQVSYVDSTAVKVLKNLVDSQSDSGREVVLWRWQLTAVDTCTNYDDTLTPFFYDGDDIANRISSQRL